jgi:hypothetical protein
VHPPYAGVHAKIAGPPPPLLLNCETNTFGTHYFYIDILFRYQQLYYTCLLTLEHYASPVSTEKGSSRIERTGGPDKKSGENKNHAALNYRARTSPITIVCSIWFTCACLVFLAPNNQDSDMSMNYHPLVAKCPPFKFSSLIQTESATI